MSAPLPTAPRPVLRRLVCALTVGTAVVLVGCASKPGAPRPDDDGPGRPPAAVGNVPDAEPRIEPLARGSNRPYTVLGRSYVPTTADQSYRQRGIASWYGRKFHGRRTSSGETYDMYAMTAAHPTLPIPSYARVRHVASGREVIVRINDRGPFHGNRILDLSYAAAAKLGIVRRGSAEVEVERITHDEIRAGTWRRSPGDEAAVVRVAEDETRSSTAAPERSSPREDRLDAPAAPAPRSEPAPGTSPDVSTPTAGAAVAPAEVTPALAATAPAAPAVAALAPPAATDAATARSSQAAPEGFWVQLGVFRQRAGAESFHRRVSDELDWLRPLLAIFDDASMFRLQAGPYPSRAEAASTALRLQDALKLVPVVVER
ncbi:septal ring lytic transglycosylase RlpA family protein [Caldimonas brevitalea]|uniref:septal ring lytic transglycosylase RlpA family protein n=1 Tax=Caldimonas brevitalea TaxID=413882 RepID=UPI001EEDCCE8|nr:septal ring lytic transglycosylase RlpA family protein [Caldimonas brevitalea]